MKSSIASLIGLATLALPSALPAQPGALCDSIKRAMAAAHATDTSAETLHITLPGTPANPANCGFSIDLSGSKSTNCNWAFPYRSPAATAAFETLLKALTACADPAFEVTHDQQVNHPDYYDLRLFRTPDGEVGLSLKDKGALQQTYIFLRTTPAR